MTDFGLDDFFVPSVKAVILSLNPAARVVDITHNVPSFDVRAGGFILSACAPFFPERTIFLSVVDPGVGSERRILLARTARHDFIAPDNGLLTRVLEQTPARELRSVSAPKFFLAESGRTFDGRDRMAPAAAWISLGTPISELGPRVDGYEKHPVRAARVENSVIRGEVAYVDKFGNLITNIPSSFVGRLCGPTIPPLRMRVRGRTIDTFLGAYAHGRRGEFFILEGSLGMLEVALRQDSAAVRLKARPGDEVILAPR